MSSVFSSKSKHMYLNKSKAQEQKSRKAQMGFNVLKTSPVSCSSRTFSSVLSNLNFIHSPTTTRLFTNRLNSLAPSLLKLKPLTVTGTGCISSSGFYRSLRFEQNKRSFRGGVVLAVASGPASVNKSEEEWRAILSPEQFRILRQKATEFVIFLWKSEI